MHVDSQSGIKPPDRYETLRTVWIPDLPHKRPHKPLTGFAKAWKDYLGYRYLQDRVPNSTFQKSKRDSP